MSTFNRFKKTTEDLFGGEKKNYTQDIREENLDNDNEFEFDIPQEAEENIVIEDASETPFEIAKMNVTRIGEDTVVTGNIKTKGHIDVLGTIKGNIVAEGNVALRSDIKGNVKGNNIGLGGCNITGDLEAEKNILTDADSEINGNVKGGEISIAGQVTGDIKAISMLVLKKEAVMEGDIDTDGLVVEPGAIINGKISISRKPDRIGSRKGKPLEDTKPKAEAAPARDEDVIDVKDEDITDI